MLTGMVLIIWMSATANASISPAGDTTKLYDPNANVATDVAACIRQAKRENKQVMLQIGGNWCVWCYRFNAFVETDSTLRNLLHNNYIVYHLNYSRENMNLDYLAKLGFPQRFGFPVIVILDSSGTRIHTQNSALLEKGNGYDFEKVRGFFIDWSPNALNPAYYKQ